MSSSVLADFQRLVEELCRVRKKERIIEIVKEMRKLFTSDADLYFLLHRRLTLRTEIIPTRDGEYVVLHWRNAAGKEQFTLIGVNDDGKLFANHLRSEIAFPALTFDAMKRALGFDDELPAELSGEIEGDFRAQGDLIFSITTLDEEEFIDELCERLQTNITAWIRRETVRRLRAELNRSLMRQRIAAEIFNLDFQPPQIFLRILFQASHHAEVDRICEVLTEHLEALLRLLKSRFDFDFLEEIKIESNTDPLWDEEWLNQIHPNILLKLGLMEDCYRLRIQCSFKINEKRLDEWAVETVQEFRSRITEVPFRKFYGNHIIEGMSYPSVVAIRHIDERHDLNFEFEFHLIEESEIVTSHDLRIRHDEHGEKLIKVNPPQGCVYQVQFRDTDAGSEEETLLRTTAALKELAGLNPCFFLSAWRLIHAGFDSLGVQYRSRRMPRSERLE